VSEQRVSPYSESLVFDWSQFTPRHGLVCLPAIAIVVLGSVLLHHPVAATVAGGGAVSVGFGSFQRIKNSRLWPMLLACLGMFISALFGTMAGYSSFLLVILAGIWGFSYGMLAAIGGGAAWAGLQCVIAMLVASGYPQTFKHALVRALLILGGGLFQTLSIILLHRAAPSPDSTTAQACNPIRRSSAYRYALRLAISLALCVELVRHFGFANGYWAPMTAVLVLKPDFHRTLTRGVARVLGTLAGAALATIIVSALQPGMVTVAMLVISLVWLCYSLVQVNYALYAACLTVYVVFLLALSGLPEGTAVTHRAINTAIGGGFALLAYLGWPSAASQTSAP
jgi:uncharacterized membrane protein YccC